MNQRNSGLGRDAWFKEGAGEFENELYTLCETIGDATNGIELGMFEADELPDVQAEISAMKHRVRILLGRDSSWEPEGGNWRMGCY